MRTALGLPALVAVILLFTGCSGGSGPVGEFVPLVETSLGDPIEGLTPTEQAEFELGRQLMDKRFGFSEGLGPFYNAESCRACHEIPTTGGSAPIYRNFFMAAVGDEGNQFAWALLPSFVMPAYGQLDGRRPSLPDPQVVGSLPITVTQRNAPPMFGVGLFEFVSDETIMANARPDAPGISGRYNRQGGTIGRFGWKAQANNLEAFLRGALNNQMGITTNPLQGSAAAVHMSGSGVMQISSNPDDPIFDQDGVPDPELSGSELGAILAFSRFLAPPAPLLKSPVARLGEGRFLQIGCADCHIPVLPSSRGPLHAYTDLLLHDMGPELADGLSLGSPQPSLISPPTTGSEFRTAPLWGVRMHAPYLHDGRADTLHDAIVAHGGEAAPSRDAYLSLSAADREALLAFLETL